MKSPDTLHPCFYMKHALHSLASGDSGGLWLMYAKLHLNKCPKCQEAYEALKTYMEEAKNTPPPSSNLSPEFWTDLESGFDKVDQQEKHKKSG